MKINPISPIMPTVEGRNPALRLVNSDGSEVKTGDILWDDSRSYIFIRHDNRRVEVQTTDDRRMFMWMNPGQLKLRFESL